MHRILSPADYRRTAWKNGGGRTAEIAAYPPHADAGHFVWRASVADVERDGPFSAFAGVERTIVLLRGTGLRLAGAGEPVEIRARFEPVTFAGDERCECALVDGAVRVFNLMIRRDAARGRLAVVCGEAATVEPTRFRICYAADGDSECLLAGHPPLVLRAGHALVVDAEEAAPPALHVNPLSTDAVALAAAVDSRGARG
jgi:environmental stress-induced protein Ves